jgi:hypothetical protein
VDKIANDELSIKTTQPQTAWAFKLGPSTLKISSTSAGAILTASAPAPTSRVVARILDPEGEPVTWKGTDEVARGYGGSETQNQSFLPRRNPECMYFALGHISASNLHSLFDRSTDTAISFSDQAVMQRNGDDRDQLDMSIPVRENTLVRLVPDYFTKTLGVPFYVPFDDSYFPRAPIVWNSWTAYYNQVTEQDIVRNADWIAGHLKPYGFEFVVLDEGYDGEEEKTGRISVGENHLWIGQWDRLKFPHGPQWLTHHLRSEGLKPGLWIVPNAYAGAVEQHPDWYLRDKQGHLIRDYDTPALDSTNPEVLNFLKKLFTTLDDWGFEYYKFDGEHALPMYVPGVDRSRLYDRSIDPLVAYRNRLKLIRETIGSKRFIEGCPAGTPLNGIGYFNSYFNGEDLYDSWEGMHNLFTSITANAFLNHLAVYVMTGEGIDVEPPMSVDEAKAKRDSAFAGLVGHVPLSRFGVTMAEARTLVSYLSLTGVVYSVASVMPELPEERIRFLQATLPTMPIIPIDLFSRGTELGWDASQRAALDARVRHYPEILDLKVNAKSGVYDVVGLTNWGTGTVTRTLSFADKLGLSPGSRCVVFDFWNQKLFGVFKDQMKVEIGSHDTRVFLVHSVINRPQLVGTSRHITGAYSILDLAWDSRARRLGGSSLTMPGQDYTLWFYIPDGMSFARAQAVTDGQRKIPTRHELTGNSLAVTFPGQQGAVRWQIDFTATPSE